MLEALFHQLIADRTSHEYTAVPIASVPDAFLGVDAVGRPALFLRSSVPSSEAPLRTAQVSLRLSAPFALTSPSSEALEGLFNCLICEATDPASIGTFLILVEALINSNSGDAISDATIANFFRSVVRLFAVQPTRDLAGARQGLWGELFMMRSMEGFRFWSPFWHAEPGRRFDFSADGKRVEVKTALEGPRIHHFSHRQIYALPGEQILIASLIVNIDDAGMSLRQLMEECRQAILDTPHFMKLERAVRRAGMEDPSEPGPRYDPQAASLNLAWYASEDVPHFRVPEPPGVSDTRYRVDLSTAPRKDIDEVTTSLKQWFSTQFTAA